MHRNRLYAVLLIACAAGYIWLFYNMRNAGDEAFEVCLVRRVTGIPCPSCGSTRAVEALLQGDVLRSLHLNPFGMVIATVMLVAPIWVVVDLVSGKRSLWRAYGFAENALRKPPVAVLLAVLVLLNWFWNFIKYL